MKVSKRNAFRQSVILAGVAGGLLFFGACSSTKVLENNGDIPAPSLTPPDNANQLVTQELQTQPVITVPEQPEVIQTATNAPGFKEDVEGKVKYTVQKGDSLWRISKMFDVSVRELAAYNNMDTNKKLKAGTILQIPPSGLAVPKFIAPTPSTEVKHKKHTTKTSVKKTNGTVHSGNNGAYTVKKGDSLKSIAKKHGTTVKELVATNNGLTSKSKLKAGQKLNIPVKNGKIEQTLASTETKKAAAPETKQVKDLNDLINIDADNAAAPKPADNGKAQASTSTTPAPTTATAPAADTKTAPGTEQKPIAPLAPNYLPHTVKDGDTWQVISDMYGLSIDDLKKANSSITTGEPKTGTTVNIPEE